ncbi:MAG: bifunctional oligoribonuclease/PAP phosphatase NrnA [Lachnospiraceae bacterium]|nr:bifunctional oligoribonuclease/PAP phosphatase NrnA [Lachnospiraceae bacterium]
MNNFDRFSDIAPLFAEAGKIAIAGHVRPDGDCIGACMGMYNYLKDNVENACDKQIDVYLEEIPESFGFLGGLDAVRKEVATEESYDLFVVLDCGDEDRLGKAAAFLKSSAHTIVVDHHITNSGFGEMFYVRPEASSACELLCDIFESDRIGFACAEALYLGIVHDTGVFKHSNTTRHTMECAGILLEKGVSSSKIIDGTFYEKTYVQNQILGRCLLESILLMDGKVIVSSVSKKTQEFYGLMPSDLDGIIDQMRVTKGVEVAILLKESEPLEWRVSMRSNNLIDVSRICSMFGGGGHVRAAGCDIKGSFFDAVNSITACIESQMESLQNR